VTDHTIAKSVIKTTERMSYPDCNALLAGDDPALAERYAAILPMLREMAVLSHKLEGLRNRRGALNLTSSAVSIQCNAQGEPVGLVPEHSGESEKIIESFMLLANETVAEHLVKENLPGVFRVHQEPTAEKLERLRGLISPFGYTLDTPDAFGMQKLLKAAEGTQEETAISMALLRSLMKAKYEGENQGHFGLGAEYYCHFTSPIRRYPDLMVHRILSQSLTANPRLTHFRKQVGGVAQQSSYREVEAETAQRDAEKCYLAEYMQSHVGEKYPGVISGITRNGLFVLLPNGAEGRVAVETMPGYYDYDEEGMTLTGGNPRTVYRFALPVTVVVAAADPGTGLIDLTLDGIPVSQPQFRRHEERPFSKGGKKNKGKRGRNQRSVSVPRKKGKGKRKR
jgi:ribonuclease R